jgi:hypothetical protein
MIRGFEFNEGKDRRRVKIQAALTLSMLAGESETQAPQVNVSEYPTNGRATLPRMKKALPSIVHKSSDSSALDERSATDDISYWRGAVAAQWMGSSSN